jgi:hypothetical protein
MFRERSNNAASGESKSPINNCLIFSAGARNDRPYLFDASASIQMQAVLTGIRWNKQISA